MSHPSYIEMACWATKLANTQAQAVASAAQSQFNEQMARDIERLPLLGAVGGSLYGGVAGLNLLPVGLVGGAGVGLLTQALRRALAKDDEEKERISLLKGTLLGAGLGAAAPPLAGAAIGGTLGGVAGYKVREPLRMELEAGKLTPQ